MATRLIHIPLKLVRDKIPAIIRENGGYCITSKLSVVEHRKALLEKLIEEAEEVRNAKTNEKRQEELADLLEVLLTVQVAFNYSPAAIDTIRKQKSALRGGFVNGIKLLFSYGG